MKVVTTIFIIIGSIILFSVTGFVCGWFGEAAQVAQEEFGPREMLRKYNWFKNAAAQLDNKRASIAVYNSRFKNLTQMYGNELRRKWAREDREQYNIWLSEVAGIKASYNQLAGQYNAQMAKFNWQFTNAGSLPKGATEVLPREFREYITE